MIQISNKQLKELLELYFIMGSQNCTINPVTALEQAIKGGITIFQFREKGTGALTGNDKYSLAKELQAICKQYNIPFIVNDDVELALEIGADGIHVGQEDEMAKVVRNKIGDRILGVSAYTMEEAKKAISDGADYLGVGPIFHTDTKQDAKAAQGTNLIRSLRKKNINIPIVGIGGITINNTKQVIEAGADGISVISAISNASNIAESARDLRTVVKAAKC